VRKRASGRTHRLDEAQVVVVLLLALHELEDLVLVRDLALVERVADLARDARRPVVGFGLWRRDD